MLLRCAASEKSLVAIFVMHQIVVGRNRVSRLGQSMSIFTALLTSQSSGVRPANTPLEPTAEKRGGSAASH